VDIFMCGTANPQRALEALVEALSPTQQHVEVAARGRGAS
jgi:S-adenosylmethionine/arginine decarboxylase-like enzyme